MFYYCLLGKRRVECIHKVRVQGQLFTHSSLGHEIALSKKFSLDTYFVNMIDPSHPVQTINVGIEKDLKGGCDDDKY